MPWTADQATAHTKAANTPRLRQLWAKVANERLEAGADDATAIREANAAVNQARGKGRGYRMIALGLACWTLPAGLAGCEPCAIVVAGHCHERDDMNNASPGEPEAPIPIPRRSRG